MVFKKPYAFFIKYFRLINLFLTILLIYFTYRLNLLHNVLKDIYFGNMTNFSNMDTSYIGYVIYLLLFVICLIIISIIMTLKRKNKPFRDYLFNIIYNIFIIAYFLSVNSLFLTLSENVVEQTTLKLYNDISFLIMFPLFYFILKYILIVIGFDLKKFNFQKDIIEMKQTAEDNEEVEVIFDKHTYKVKRGIRKYFRELKYYFLENKLFIGIICGGVLLAAIIALFSINLFNSNKVKIKESFNAGNFSYKVMNVYETKYDLNQKVIKDDSKFVIAMINVKNNYIYGQSIDFKRIRILFNDDYVYANDYYNNYFYDLGNPYNGEILETGKEYNYLLIFKVPNSYKSKKYTLKFYDKLTMKGEETIGSYKELKINAKSINYKQKVYNLNLNENIVFNKNSFGNSNITINNYDINNIYSYNNGNVSKIIRDKDINNLLLIIDYKLEFDKKSSISKYFKEDKDFFSNYLVLEYELNNNIKRISNLKAIANVDNKVILSVPYNLNKATKINLILNFRDVKISYKLK